MQFSGKNCAAKCWIEISLEQSIRRMKVQMINSEVRDVAVREQRGDRAA